MEPLPPFGAGGGRSGGFIVVVLILFVALVLVFVLFVLDVRGAGIGEAYVAKTALDLDAGLAIACLAGVVLIEAGAGVVVTTFSLFPYVELTVVVEIAEAGMHIEVGGEAFGDDHLHIGVGFVYGELLYILCHIELYVVGEFAADLDLSVDLPDHGLLIEFEHDLAVGDFGDIGFSKLHVDVVEVVEATRLEAAEFACQRNETFEIPYFCPAKAVLYVEPVAGGHVHDIIDVEGSVVVTGAAMFFLVIIVYLADLGLEVDDMAALYFLHINLVHDLFCFFFRGGAYADGDVNGDLAFIPGVYLDVAELVLDLELVLGSYVVGFVDGSFFPYFFVTARGFAYYR